MSIFYFTTNRIRLLRPNEWILFVYNILSFIECDKLFRTICRSDNNQYIIMSGILT